MDILEQYKHVKEHKSPTEIFLWMEEAAEEIRRLRQIVHHPPVNFGSTRILQQGYRVTA